MSDRTSAHDDPRYRLTQLETLEAEAIHIIREVVAELERPGAAVLRRQGLDRDAAAGREGVRARPRIPFPVMHVDTGHNFPEVLEFRDRRVAELGRAARSSAQRAGGASTPGWCGRSRTARATASRRRCCSTRSRSTASTRCSAAPAATRRRRAPRSGCSPSATSSASGTRRTSAPSCGTSTTAGIHLGESIRVFPLSNWTELDIWQYIAPREDRDAVDLLRARARGGRARRDALRGQRVHPAARGRAGRHREGALPHGRRRHLHRRRALRRATPSRRSSPRSRRPG